MKAKQGIQNVYGVTPMQEGMIFHSLLDQKSQTYLQQFSFLVSMTIDLELFEQSINEVINKYEALRTNYIYKDVKKPLQVVLKKRTLKTVYKDISGLDKDEQLSVINEFINKDRVKGFDLAKEILIRVKIFKVEEAKYQMIWSFHHIIMDGWCMGIIMQDILVYYDKLKHNKPIVKENIPSYSQYINWLKKQDIESSKKYWRKYLDGYTEPATLMNYGQAGEKIEYKAKEVKIAFSEQETVDLIRESQRQKVTLNAVLQVAWGLLMHTYYNQTDIVFGSVVSGRHVPVLGIERMVGLFINTIPVRVKAVGEEKFLDVVKRIQQDIAIGNENSYLSLADIQNDMGFKQGIVDHLFNFENYPIEEMMLQETIEDIKIEDVKILEQTNYNLNVKVNQGEKLKISIIFNENIYKEEWVKTLLQHFKSLILSVKDDFNITINKTSLLTQKEEIHIKSEFNSLSEKIDYKKTLVNLFEEQVSKTPNNLAFQMGNKKLTYDELNKKANNLAWYLKESGVQKEEIVALMVERSCEMAIGILAVLKAGGAFLPIDPTYPKERIEYLLKDSGVKRILVDKLYDSIEISCQEVINLKEDKNYYKEDKNLNMSIKNTDLAYIIYTSGTTGKPKGVMIEHKGASNAIQFRKIKLGLCDKHRALQLFSYSFDGFITSFFTPIISGSSVVFLEEQEAKNPICILKAIEKYKITHFISVPILYSSILDMVTQKEQVASLEVVSLGGEKVTKEVINKNNKINPKIKIANEYGPTENSVISTFNIDTANSNKITIGTPIWNTKVWILDPYGRMCPIGIKGEICVSGIGVARGYLYKEDLTETKFVKYTWLSEERIYKTGDLGCWEANGEVECSGRIDHQIKLRGYRIECDEIKSTILKYKGIKKAEIILKKNSLNEDNLCAVLVAEDEVKKEELKAYLKNELPHFMVPHLYVFLDKMPITPNGKLDIKYLQDIPLKEEVAVMVYPESELEKAIHKIWQEVLQKEQISVEEDFFELGGHSLNAIQVIAKLESQNIQVTMLDLFNNTTIRKLAKAIEKKQQDKEKYINNYQQAEEILKEKLNVNTKIWRKEIDNQIYDILVIQTSASFNEEVLMNFIQRYFEDKICPHYIIYTTEDVNELEEDNWEELVKLEEQVDGLHNELSNIKTKWEMYYDKLENAITQGAYPISPIQTFSYYFPECTGIAFTLRGILKTELLRQAINQVIYKHSLLRSILRNKEGKLVWEEKQITEPIDIPVINIKQVHPLKQSIIMNDIAEEIFFREYECEQELLYRPVIVQQNLRISYVCIAFNHMIFDLTTSQILKKEILENYYKLIKDTPIEINQESYSQYVKQLEKGPDMTEEDIISKFEVIKYIQASEQLKEALSDVKNSEMKVVTTTIKMKNSSANEQQLWNKAFVITMQSLSKLLQMDNLPITLMSYGRDYENKRFFDGIGEYQDSIPVYVSDILNNGEKEVLRIQEKISDVKDKNINFLSFYYNDGNSKGYEKIEAYIKKIFTLPTIKFNYLGKSEEEEKDTSNWFTKKLLSKKMDIKEYKDICEIDVQVRQYDDELEFRVIFPNGMKVEEIEKTFKEAANNILR